MRHAATEITLEIIYYVGQIISVVAVVVSLIFVGLQIRHDSIATKAASHDALSTALNETNRLFAENAALSKNWSTGIRDLGLSQRRRRLRRDDRRGGAAKQGTQP